MFRVGQKVVCVDDSEPSSTHVVGYDGHHWQYFGGLDGLTKGAIYTVRAFVQNHINGGVSLCLAEIFREHTIRSGIDIGECGYRASRFRPVVERKTDISIFTEILRKHTKKQQVPA